MERSIENTDAESVDDIVAASRRAVRIPMRAEGIVMPSTYQATKPVSMAVSSTPTVARMTPWGRTGRISEYLVSSPPENRMIQSAMVPITLAASMFSNCMPKPSLPLIIPTPRNSSNAGTPRREPALLTKMERKKRSESARRII